MSCFDEGEKSEEAIFESHENSEFFHHDSADFAFGCSDDWSSHSDIASMGEDYFSWDVESHYSADHHQQPWGDQPSNWGDHDQQPWGDQPSNWGEHDQQPWGDQPTNWGDDSKILDAANNSYDEGICQGVDHISTSEMASYQGLDVGLENGFYSIENNDWNRGDLVAAGKVGEYSDLIFESGKEERHHFFPSNYMSAIDLDYSKYSGLCIVMEKEDHRQLDSTGNSDIGKDQTDDFLQAKSTEEIFNIAADDIRDKFGSKYDAHISELKDYISSSYQ